MKKFLNGVDATNNRVVNVASGTQPTDAVNLSQLTSAVNGLAWKQSVRAGSTGNVTVSSPGTTIDGVTLAVNDSILLKNQTTQTENGIYIFNGSTSALTRRSDANSAQNFVDNTTVYISEGTTLADTAWTCTNNGTITPGTTNIAFAQVGSQVAYTGDGTTIVLNGTVFSTGPAIPKKYAAAIGDGSSTTITVTHNLNTQDVNVDLYNATSGERVDTDVTGRTANALTLVFSTPPATGAYRIVVLG